MWQSPLHPLQSTLCIMTMHRCIHNTFVEMDCPITLSEVPVKALTPHTSVKSKNFFSAKLPTIQNPLTNIQFPNPLKKPNKSDVSIKDIRTQANQLSNSYDGILQKFFATESQTLRKCVLFLLLYSLLL